MGRGTWRATVQRGCKESDTAEQLGTLVAILFFFLQFIFIYLVVSGLGCDMQDLSCIM